MPDDVSAVLAQVAAGLPGGGEEREGQRRMAVAVERAIAEERHLVVQAGTGTGKSLAYLVPAVLSGRRTVVATATKALQDQLAGNDLPALSAAIGAGFSFAVLKGRSNYLCRQRVTEIGGGGEQMTLPTDTGDPPDPDDNLGAEEPVAAPRPGDAGRLGDQLRQLVRWAGTTVTGDRAELGFEPSRQAWAMVSTTARECPGAFRCPSGHDCFAEDARSRAAEADVVVVNTHLYGAHLASGGAVLPPHDVVVFDEAHEVEDVMTDSLGVDVAPGRFRALAASTRPLLDPDTPGAAEAADALSEVGEALQRTLRPLAGQRLLRRDLQTGAAPPGGGDRAPAAGDTELAGVVALAAGRVDRLLDHLRRAERELGEDGPAGARSRRDRALLAAGHLAADLARLGALTDDEVAWVDGSGTAPSLRVAPIDVAPLLSERLWDEVTGVLTSATLPLGLPARLGLPTTEVLDVGSPFDYRGHAMLYVARSLPDRRRPESEPALHDELERLVNAAGGRTLALFTSWRAMHAAVDALRHRLAVPLLSQSDLPKPALVEAFRDSEPTCLFATLGFWQGVDLPGRTLSLVTIDRIPFPRPNDPVFEARRERAGPGAFAAVDLPRAGTLLAQGAGRLIRSSEDRGVVAVLDSRLATASYRGALLARVPPMRRSVDRTEVEGFLRRVTAGS